MEPSRAATAMCRRAGGSLTTATPAPASTSTSTWSASRSRHVHEGRHATGVETRRSRPFHGWRPLSLRRHRLLLHRGRLRSLQVRVLLLDVFLVVDALGVHGPEVVLRAAHEVLHRAHCGEHRVVRVVVAMQAIAAHLLEVADGLEPRADRSDPRLVVAVVHRIGLRHAHGVAALNLGAISQPELLELTRREFDELLVAHVPQLVALEAEVLEPDAGLRLVGHHPRTPRAVVLDASHLHAR